ncbi:MAG: hypothetical protein KF801_06515 [Cryobacterium sp.]|jgi:hypothetical protein|nr:hypothetical protein [Cryobacterium sp.]
MKFRAIVVPASIALALSLAGCAPEPLAPSPSPSASIPAPSETPSASPTGIQLTLPDDCDVLVPLPVIQAQFASNFESIFMIADNGGPDAQSFAARGGLTCLWGIPNSDAGFVTVFAAQRLTDTDAEQVATWQADGDKECPPFMDACYFDDSHNEIGEVWTVHVLVEGFELEIQATSSSIDPLLVVAREAATNMGYI